MVVDSCEALETGARGLVMAMSLAAPPQHEAASSSETSNRHSLTQEAPMKPRGSYETLEVPFWLWALSS